MKISKIILLGLFGVPFAVGACGGDHFYEPSSKESVNAEEFIPNQITELDVTVGLSALANGQVVQELGYVGATEDEKKRVLEKLEASEKLDASKKLDELLSTEFGKVDVDQYELEWGIYLDGGEFKYDKNYFNSIDEELWAMENDHERWEESLVDTYLQNKDKEWFKEYQKNILADSKGVDEVCYVICGSATDKLKVDCELAIEQTELGDCIFDYAGDKK